MSVSVSKPGTEQAEVRSAQLGAAELSLSDAIAQSLAIGPVFSATFLAALIASAAGPAAPLATLIGTISALAIAWVIVLFARRYVGAGAVYDYVRRVASPGAGLVAAGMYFIGTLFLMGIFMPIGFFTAGTVSAYAGIDLPWWLYALVAAALIFAVNHLGVKVTTRTQLFLSVASLIPLLLLALVIIAKGGAAGNTLAVFDPSSVDASGLFRGVLFAITLFIGFEASASLGEETANPQRDIPRAVIGTVSIAALFYLLVIYASAIGFGLDNSAAWASDPSPLGTLATRYVGGWLAPWVDAALLIDMLAVASAFMATSARGWFALARHELLPSWLARTSTRYRTPLGGNLLVFAFALLLIVLTAASALDPMLAFGIATGLGSLLIQLIYAALVLLVLRLLRGDERRWWHWPLLALALAGPVLAIYGSLVPFPPYPASLGVFGALLAIALVAAWAATTMTTRRAHLDELAREEQL